MFLLKVRFGPIHLSQRPTLALAEVNSLTESDEECLRPSLLRKRHRPSIHRNTPHRGNVPWSCQSMTPDHKASRVTATAYDSPAHQTPFTALFSSCPSTGVESRAASSPAEHSLFGKATPSSLLGAFSPTPDANGYASADLQQQIKSSPGMSKVIANISNLKKQHAQLAQQLKVGATAFMLALRVLRSAFRCTSLNSDQLFVA